MLNHIVVMGRLTRDPELRSTYTGLMVATFTIAVDRDYQEKNSDQKQTDFIECVAWRATADFVSRYFSKGKMAIVEGRLQSRKWQDKQGNNRTSWEIKVDNIYFSDSKKESEKAAQGPAMPASTTAASMPPDGFEEIEDDEDLPF